MSSNTGRPRRRNGSTRRWRILRARWARTVATGTVVCRRCGNIIRPGQDWHLGHLRAVVAGGTDTPDNVSPEHATCNLRAGAYLRETGTEPPDTGQGPAFSGWPDDEPERPDDKPTFPW